MAYRTINLSPRTYARLRQYKVAGSSFDEAVAALMDRVPPREIYEEALRAFDRSGLPRGKRAGRGARSLERALRAEFRKSWPKALRRT
jgi:hypothetical protein